MTKTTQAPQTSAPDDVHPLEDTHQAETVAVPEAVDDTPPAPTPDEKPAMGEQLKALYTDAQTWLEAEIGFQKGRVSYTARAAKLGAIALGVGIFTLLCSLITLLLGIFMTVAHYFGPLVAMLTVPLVWAVLGWLALRYAKLRLKDTKAMLAETGGITGRKSDDAGEDGL